jgi:hypothetical protein
MISRKSMLFGICAAILGPALASSQTLNDVSPPLRMQAECMFHVLRQIPGIDNVKLEVSDDERWIHPYLEYRIAPNRDGYATVVHFGPERPCLAGYSVNCCPPNDRNQYCFMTIQSGILRSGTTTPGTVPSDGGSIIPDALLEKWKAECGVSPETLIE